MVSYKILLIPLSTFLIGGICGASIGINWTAGSMSPLRLYPVTQEQSARSYGVGQGTALMNCILLKRSLIEEGDEDAVRNFAYYVRWRSLHWSKYPVDWNYFWQGYNDTIKYYRKVKADKLSKYNPGICRHINPYFPPR